MDLRSLPDVELAPLDPAVLLAKGLAIFEKELKRPIYEGDPVDGFLRGLCAFLLMAWARLELGVRQGFLASVGEGFIEHLGAFLNVKRLQPTFAKTRLRFTLQAPQVAPVIIPKRTRVASSGSTYFSTDFLAEIPPGELFVEVDATALDAGVACNGILPGQIKTVVDPLPYVVELTNLTVTSGGADKEELEAYRERIRLAPEEFSTAGPRLAYVALAKGAHQDICDASATSPSPGRVVLTVLCRGGRIPDPAGPECEAVRKKCSADMERPFTDEVVVGPPAAHAISYQVRWYLENERDAEFQAIEAALKKAVDDFDLRQRSELGLDVVPDDLISACRAAGAKRIEHPGLAFIPLERNEIANLTSTVVFGGLEGR